MNPSWGNRRPTVPLALRLFTLLLGVACLGPGPGCRPPPESEQGARLLLTTAELAPDSTFELRLDESLVGLESVGNDADPSPLVVSPPLSGRFVWRSRRSGLFTPEEPLQLHTAYEFRLRPGLTNADGRPVQARLRRRFQTPPLQGDLSLRDQHPLQNAPVLPEFELILNAPVERSQVRRLAAFVSGRQRVGVTVEPVVPPPLDPAAIPVPVSLGTSTWRERFQRGNPGMAGPTATNSRPDLNHHFILRPDAPLPPGEAWTLRIAPGLRSPEVPGGRTAEMVAQVGRVIPFDVLDLEPENDLVNGHSLLVRFSRPILSTNCLSHIRVTPEVEGLSVGPSPSGRALRLRGPFRLRQDYSVTFLAGLPAAEPVGLATNSLWTVSWEPMPAHVRLPFFDTPQLAGGSRDLELVAVNTPEVRLRVKALDEHTLIHTRRAYQKYLRSDPPGDSLDFDGVAGRTLLETNLITRAPTDEARRVKLSWDQLLPPGTRGALFVEAGLDGASPARSGSRPGSGPQGIVQLTDLGWMVKRGAGSIDVWVFSHRTGQGVPGAAVSVRSEENEIRSTGRTNPEGCVRLPEGNPGDWLLVEKAGDLHAAPIHDGEVPTWRFQLPGGWPTAQTLRIEGFTDREAYRPGERLHLQAYAREWGAEGWNLPDPAAVRSLQVRLVDPHQQTLVQTNVALRPTGSLDWIFLLPDTFRGTCQIQLRPVPAAAPAQAPTSEPPTPTTNGSESEPTVLEVQVRDFDPPAFEVLVPGFAELSADAPLEVPIRARHLFGEPLSRALVAWGFSSEAHRFSPKGWDRYRFGHHVDDAEAGEQAAPTTYQSGRETLTARAPVILQPRLEFPAERPEPRLGRLRVDVTDLNQQTVGQTTERLRHSSDFYLGFRWAGGPEAVFATNQTLPFELVAVTPGGEPFSGPVDVTARVWRREWRTVRVEEAGGSLNYRSEATNREVAQIPVRTLGAARRGQDWEADPGTAPVPSLPALEQPGAYQAEFTARDPAGRAVVTRVEFEVSGDARLAWNFRNGTLLELVPDRAEYAPGESATLLVKAPFSGTAWVTVDREGVRRAFTTALSGNAPAIQVPLRPGDAPNVFVSVQLVRGHADSPHQFPLPEWRVGYVSLPVRDPADRLGVSVASSREECPPGTELTATARVTGPEGRAVAGAEVVMYAVDEGFLLLQGTPVPDLPAALHRPRPLAVTTHVSLPELFPENPALRFFGNKGHPGGGGGLDGIRRDFIPCPLWKSGLRTDDRGEVRVTFRAPDGLTRYRLVAVATHGACQAGQDAVTFAVRKPLMVEPALPRFAHVGARLQARAVVFNQTPATRRLRASLILPDHVVPAGGAGLSTSLDVAAGATAVVEFPVEILQPGAAPWNWRVETQDAGEPFQDARECSLIVTHAEPEVHDARSLRVGAGSTNVLAGLDPRFEEAAGTLTIRVAASPLAVLREGLTYLLHYPYGCVEQTSSSLLPWLALRDFPEFLPADSRPDSGLRTVVAAGVDRLFQMQTLSGGLGYWPGDGTADRWGSAYGALVLALAREAGFPVETNRLASLHRWLLEAAVGDPPEPDLDLLEARALTACALAFAERPEAGLLENLYRSLDRLPAEPRAILALALARSGEPATRVRDALARPATRKDSAWSGRFGHPARQPALELLAALRAEPDSTEVETRVERLIGLQAHGHWGTTQGNAWTIWALAEATRRLSRHAPTHARVTVAGQPHEITPASPTSLATAEIPFPAGVLRQGAVLTTEGPGRLYVDVGLAGRWSTPTNQAAPVDHGFILRRTYARLDDANRPDPGALWQVGDRVLITLELDTPENAEWVAIENPLPAVLEAIEGVFRSDPTLPVRQPGEWYDDFREMRVDRNLHFRNHLPQGSHVIRSLARVRAAGDVVAAPARVEAMYEPRRHGISGSQRVRAVSLP